MSPLRAWRARDRNEHYITDTKTKFYFQMDENKYYYGLS